MRLPALSTGPAVRRRRGPAAGGWLPSSHVIPARAEVVVIGAGLAGLSAAARLACRGLRRPRARGRRARRGPAGHRRGSTASWSTAGFQVLNTGYPRAADLDLRRARPGLVRARRRRAGRRPGAPGRRPRHRPRPVAGHRCPRRSAALPEKAALAAFSPARGLPARWPGCCGARTDSGGGAAAGRRRRRRRWSASSDPSWPACCSRTELTTSSRYLDLLWRSFVRGAIGLPAPGMQAVGEQLAARLPAGRAASRHPGRSVGPGAVDTDTGGWRADAVVVATDPRRRAAAARGDRRGAPPGHHAPARAARLALAHPLIVLGRAGRPAGQHRRRLRRPAPLQPRRPGAGRQLDARAHPGGRRPRRDRPGARGGRPPTWST